LSANVDIWGDRIVCPACSRTTEADLFYDRHGELRCGQCAARPRGRRRSVLIALGLGRSGAVPIGRKPGTQEAL
jgi:hypothetical protein